MPKVPEGFALCVSLTLEGLGGRVIGGFQFLFPGTGFTSLAEDCGWDPIHLVIMPVLGC
jgi:hypothetical protein